MKRRVMIATPAHDRTVCVEYAHSLYHTGRICAARGVDLFPVWLPGESLLQRARNDLAATAVEGKVDDLIFIDADQEWEPEHIVKLLGHPVDVVGAAVRKKTDEAELYNIMAKSPNIPVDIKTGLLIVDSVGTGFLRLSRAALLALWEMGEPYEDQGHERRMIFETRVLDGRFWSEDTVACAKLRSVGFNIHVDPSFTVGHVGIKKFAGDFATYLATLQAGALVRAGHTKASA